MTALLTIKNEQDLSTVLHKGYMKQIQNFLGNEEKALEFLSNVRASVQRNPKLLECTPETLLNSFVTMASLKLMPSGVSGEAYVLPYSNKGVMEAQFQLGYQGLVTLFYRAGARSIVAEIVREQDAFGYVNGEIRHTPNIFSDNRGPAIGAYVIVELERGGVITKAMSKKDILAIGKKFSKSFSTGFSPWNEENDPELWMWKKTALKQAAKLVPKNETIHKALAEDNRGDSNIPDRKPGATGQLTAPAADLTAHSEAITACRTLEELERTWADIPGDAKTALKLQMEGVKAMIMNEAKATID